MFCNEKNIEFDFTNIEELFQQCRAYETAETAVLLAKKQIVKIKEEIKEETKWVKRNGKSGLDHRTKLFYSERLKSMRKIMNGIVEFKGNPMKECLLSNYVTNEITRNIINKIDYLVQTPKSYLGKKINIQLQEVLNEIEEIEEKDSKSINYAKRICNFIIPNVMDWVETIPEKESKSISMIKEDRLTHINNLKRIKKNFKSQKKEDQNMQRKYNLNGKTYRKIGRDEIIKEGALHSFDGGKLCPISNPQTIGDIPKSFSDKREFYNPI